MTITIADNWGATAEEVCRPFPCDERIAAETVALYRAVSIRAAPAVVFRWLCQMRLAPYSYDWVDNLGRRSPRTLTPGSSKLRIGQRVMLIFSLEGFATNEHLTLELALGEVVGRLSGPLAISYVVSAEQQGTRLVVKIVAIKPAGVARMLAWRALAWGDLVMMRKQLLTFKELAERTDEADLIP